MSKNVPKVRFDGFNGDWEERILGAISEKITEKNKDNLYSETFTNSAEFGIINQRDFFEKDISNKKNLDGYFIIRPDDFVYNPRISNRAPVGPIKRNTLGRTGVMSPLYYAFRVFGIDKSYLEIYFSSSYWYKFMKLNGDSGARADRFAIKDSIFRKMPIPYPLLSEQQKIGTFFKQLDDTISLQQRLVEHQQQYKKVMLQKMFPQKGERVPKVRFDEFSGDWIEKELSEISIRITKGTTPADKSWEGTIKYIKTDSINSINGNIENTSRISKKEHETNLKRSKLEVNDILFSIVGTLGRVGIVKEKDLPANTNQQICIIRLNEGDINFIFTALKTPLIEKFIKSDATIGAQPSISLWQMEALKVPFPQIDEQQKIGAFFKQLDDKITLEEKKLEGYQQLKKALLQRMFV
ncbi:type I restriction endonuclease subunit S [Priestia megaterium]|uniref:restriction endonuclease subunit S n=1 Tax=Priestia megaterium TaxID=1404 RepID=UPI000BECDEC1|nr:restriction endonuclease subunit S [Priestia megaterium]PEC41865.1 type I restriction endonuclease subunit S [Priestia megaterium]